MFSFFLNVFLDSFDDSFEQELQLSQASSRQNFTPHSLSPSPQHSPTRPLAPALHPKHSSSLPISPNSPRTPLVTSAPQFAQVLPSKKEGVSISSVASSQPVLQPDVEEIISATATSTASTTSTTKTSTSLKFSYPKPYVASQFQVRVTFYRAPCFFF